MLTWAHYWDEQRTDKSTVFCGVLLTVYLGHYRCSYTFTLPSHCIPLPLPVTVSEINVSSFMYVSYFSLGEKAGNEPEEVKLQNASKQIVQNAILQAVQQVSRESRQKEDRTGDNQSSFQLGVGELTKKHEKK
ncbi:A-kinase anchor protein inhibitor 1 [Loxodonta africana]|uniref:A-kinase anchor protein inhibitor 1 n=1 Tax=Loxodonta africana TaxID=9785 RepID=UPI0030D5C046